MRLYCPECKLWGVVDEDGDLPELVYDCTSYTQDHARIEYYHCPSCQTDFTYTVVGKLEKAD